MQFSPCSAHLVIKHQITTTVLQGMASDTPFSVNVKNFKNTLNPLDMLIKDK